MTVLTLLIVGFFVGMKHAIDSDHLAAIATLATRRQTLGANVRQGIAWGIGHTFTLMLIGGAVLAMGAQVPKGLEQVLELCVALMLIVLGIDVLRRLRREKIHFHTHRHQDGVTHFHAHSHVGDLESRLPRVANPSDLPVLDWRPDHVRVSHEHEHERCWPIRALAVGIMHGMAGSAALVLLSLEAVSVSLGLTYIFVFGLGSIVGMTLLSVVIAVPLRLSSRYVTGVYRALTIAIAVITICLGAALVVSIGADAGLLLSA